MLFGFFDEVAPSVFFVDFVIFFSIPFLTKFIFRSKIRSRENYLQNINAYAKEGNKKTCFCVKNMSKYDEKAIIARIRSLREQYVGGRGKSKFARALNISPSTYNYYENNRIPPIEILLKICEVTGADLDWLLTGQSTGKEPESGPKSGLLQKLDKLFTDNPEMTEAVLAFIELLCEQKGIVGGFRSGPLPSEAARPGWIPVLGRTAAGMVHFWEQTLIPEPKQAVTELDELVKMHIGREIVGSVDGTISVDLKARPLVDGITRQQANLIQVCGQEQEQIVEFVQCEEIHKLFPDSFALHLDGDSMSPRINDCDIVILSPSVPAAQGQISIARVANQIGVTCKLIRTTKTDVHLIPINERYETKVIAKKDLLWALAVLCHVSV
jgi:transcriptional regulator with XRE-family HTH domain